MMNFLYSIFIIIATSFLTSIFSFWRFRTEKWWELKARTYTNIMESLHYIKKGSQVSLEHYLEQNYPEYSDNDIISRTSIDTDSINNQSKREKLGKEEISKIIDANAFIIQKKALLELKKLQVEYMRSLHIDEIESRIQEEIKLIDICIEKIRIIAEDDLQSVPYFLLEKIKSIFQRSI